MLTSYFYILEFCYCMHLPCTQIARIYYKRQPDYSLRTKASRPALPRTAIRSPFRRHAHPRPPPTRAEHLRERQPRPLPTLSDGAKTTTLNLDVNHRRRAATTTSASSHPATSSATLLETRALIEEGERRSLETSKQGRAHSLILNRPAGGGGKVE